MMQLQTETIEKTAGIAQKLGLSPCIAIVLVGIIVHFGQLTGIQNEIKQNNAQLERIEANLKNLTDRVNRLETNMLTDSQIRAISKQEAENVLYRAKFEKNL